MNLKDDQPLWDLLGRASRPEVSPFFARNVLRQIRSGEKGVPTEGWSWFSWRRLVPVGGLAVAAVAAFMVLQQPVVEPEPDLPPIVAEVEVQDYDEFFDLDDLLAADESSPWSEDSLL